MDQEDLFAYPDEEQIEIYYLIEEGERYKELAAKLTAPAIAEKYGYTEQWIRAVRQRLRRMFGTYTEGYKPEWLEIKKRLEGK